MHSTKFLTVMLFVNNCEQTMKMEFTFNNFQLVDCMSFQNFSLDAILKTLAELLEYMERRKLNLTHLLCCF